MWYDPRVLTKALFLPDFCEFKEKRWRKKSLANPNLVATQFLTTIAQEFNRDKFEKLNECISFDDYLNKVIENPKNSSSFTHERVLNNIMSHGADEREINGEKVPVYNFFKGSLFESKIQFMR